MDGGYLGCRIEIWWWTECERKGEIKQGSGLGFWVDGVAFHWNRKARCGTKLRNFVLEKMDSRYLWDIQVELSIISSWIHGPKSLQRELSQRESWRRQVVVTETLKMDEMMQEKCIWWQEKLSKDKPGIHHSLLRKKRSNNLTVL